MRTEIHPRQLPATTATARRAATPTPSFFGALGKTLRSVAVSPPAWLFAGVWLVAAAALVVTGVGLAIDSLLIVAFYLLLGLVTAAMTLPSVAPDFDTSRGLTLRVQLGLTLGFVVLTGWSGLAFHGVVAPDAAIPIWTPFVDMLRRVGEAWFGVGTWVSNPVTYVFVPLIVLLIAGARFSSLGFGPGHRMGRVLLLWASVPVAFIGFALLSGQLTIGRLTGRLLSNALNNGFMEEFLFRGVLQTRLRALQGAGWAIVIQAIVFGAWHLGLGFSATENAGVLPALAYILVHQAVIGMALGIVFERTRNLLVPSVAHVLINSI